MRAADSKAIISPGKIYRALGKTADCGGCMPLFLDTMRSSANLEVPFELSNLRTTLISEERYERKSEGY
ncbi:(2Fe-2S)-binding protein [Halocynthiibacter sp. C4]